jgi:hypothetical protein
MDNRIARYGWVPDLPDQRHYGCAARVEVLRVMACHSPFMGARWGRKVYFAIVMRR